MWERKDLKAQAKAAVKRNYWKSVLVGIIDSLLVSGSYTAARNSQATQQAQDVMSGNNASASEVMAVLIGFAILFLLILVVRTLLSALLIGPLRVGTSRFKIRALKETGNLGELGCGFSNNYKNNVKASFLANLSIALWSILLIIPGVIKSYEYRMVPYILADAPDMEARDVLAKSKDMMQGNKWNAFVLDLSFILWDILSAVTFGLVGLFYVQPYRSLTDAALYEALKNG